jgi:hypothetical protein
MDGMVKEFKALRGGLFLGGVFIIIKVIILLFLGAAFIAFALNGITGWGDKGESKKLVRVTLIILIVSFPFLYVLSKLLNN